MRREFRGKTCVYCSLRVCKTDDHIFAAKLFLEEDRANLPKAPACKVCNGAKSALEHYLATVLPFAGRHAQAMENLTTAVPKRLAKNLRLHREMYESREIGWLKDGTGIYQPTGVISFDSAKLAELLKYTARGLAWYHWGKCLPADYCLRVLFLPDLLSMDFRGRMQTVNNDRRVSNDLGRGTVEYEGAQVGEPPDLTFWVFSLYGGIMLSGSAQGPEPVETLRHWWVISGPPELKNQIEGLGSKDSRITLPSEATPPAMPA